MKTIKNNISNTIYIKKSKFITYLYRVNDVDEVNNILKDIKIKYNDARHIVYGYIINNNEKCSDDKEPSGTAGVPILNVLKNNDLNFILCIVIRYFGGILLGTGGLSRAYSSSCIDALSLSHISDLIEGINYEVIFDYNNSKDVDYLLSSSNIISKVFDNNVTYIVNSSIYEYNCIKDKLSTISTINEIKKIYM